MEICILKFDGTHDAEDALKEVSDAQADRWPWLREVGAVSRPLIGRVVIRAGYPEGRSTTYREGDLTDRAADLGAYTGYLVGSLSGPFRQAMLALEGESIASGSAEEIENRLFRLDEIKQALPRGSSALFLVANSDVCDEMVEAFRSYDTHVVRRDVHAELQAFFDRLQRRIASAVKEEAIGAQPSP